jgi:hypothetical protein
MYCGAGGLLPPALRVPGLTDYKIASAARLVLEIVVDG